MQDIQVAVEVDVAGHGQEVTRQTTIENDPQMIIGSDLLTITLAKEAPMITRKVIMITNPDRLLHHHDTRAVKEIRTEKKED